MTTSAMDAKQIAVSITNDLESVIRSVTALGDAIRSLENTLPPEIVRAVAEDEQRRRDLAAEFGLLTSAEAGERMGSRSATAKRNAAASARASGRLIAIRHGRYLLYPGFQFDDNGIRPVIAELKKVADEYGWREESLVTLLMAPTTYLDDDKRPVDVLDDVELVVETARNIMGVVW